MKDYPNEPLEKYHPLIGGPAGNNTPGGHRVSKPEGMPSKDEATHVVSTAKQLKDAVQVDNAVVYIDENGGDIDMTGYHGIWIGSNITIVGHFCNPDVPGRGPRIIQNDFSGNNDRRLFKSGHDSAPSLYGVSMRGPNTDLEYFNPDHTDSDYSDLYASGIHCYDDNGTFRAVGCEFYGWTVAGIELGARGYQTDAEIHRTSLHHNNMESLGYGVEQYNGHLWMDLCYFNQCRHGISGFGYDTESWETTRCLIGPDGWCGHALDMHELTAENNIAGHHIASRNCTFMITEDIAGYGQEGIAIRGVSETESEIWNNHFYHPEKPIPPGDHGEAYRQEEQDYRDNFENFNPHDNIFGPDKSEETLKTYGAPRDPHNIRENSQDLTVHGTGPYTQYEIWVDGDAWTKDLADPAERTTESKGITHLSGAVVAGRDRFGIAKNARILRMRVNGDVDVSLDGETVDIEPYIHADLYYLAEQMK
jgi:hypothetical protein